jgi:hypothetical protein
MKKVPGLEGYWKRLLFDEGCRFAPLATPGLVKKGLTLLDEKLNDSGTLRPDRVPYREMMKLKWLP